VNFEYVRGEEAGTVEVLPEEGIVEDGRAIGVALDVVGTLQLPTHLAVYEGAKLTTSLTKLTAVGLYGFVVDAFSGDADLKNITGPVGIVGLVGDASALGFVYLLSFTAFISINLAIINLLPIPALDGGRILFVVIEAIKGSAIKPKVGNMLNTIGFALLIILMVVVTFNDIIRLF